MSTRGSPWTRLRATSLAAAACTIALAAGACGSSTAAEAPAESEPAAAPTSAADTAPPASPPASNPPTVPSPPETPPAADAQPAEPSCTRPYDNSSPWNTPIGPSPEYDAASEIHIAALEGNLTSDPTQFTVAVYLVDDSTPRRTVHVGGWFSNVSNGGEELVNRQGGTVEVPIPDGAQPSAGSDAQIVLIDRQTGDEWGASNFEPRGNGEFDVQNIYHYDVAWSAVPPRSENGGAFANRGSGLPYLAGLVRPCEIARGHIDHALAFAYKYPTSTFVYPATKSDGASENPRDVPEGARLQLDPNISDDAFRAAGCDGPCLTIAHALQEYGMYTVDIQVERN